MTKVIELKFLFKFLYNTKFNFFCQKKLSIKVIELDNKIICFDLVNWDFPFTNAIRRILLSELPSMAIEKVHLFLNTSELPDFALCQRLGLIPIKVCPDNFKMKSADGKETILACFKVYFFR